MITMSIKPATTSDQEQIIAVVVLAFGVNPVARWVYPDSHEYLRHFPELIRVFAGQAFEHDSVYYISGFSGAALWLPPTVQPDEDEMVALLQRTVPERNHADMFSVLEQMDDYHPTEPHWYLPLIGVDPLQQGGGYGSALMEHALVVCDREGKLAYLESSDPRNIPLYERHGFEVMGTIQVGSSPPLFPMLRRPQSA